MPRAATGIGGMAEHHSANDREFDELYRKHLSNVYQALGATAPDYLSQPISGAPTRPEFTPQTFYIHPKIKGDMVRYFEWMGAAAYTADHRAGPCTASAFWWIQSMPESTSPMSTDASISLENLPIPTLRLWSTSSLGQTTTTPATRAASCRSSQRWPDRRLASQCPRRRASYSFFRPAESEPGSGLKFALLRNFELKLPLEWLLAKPVQGPSPQPTNGGPHRHQTPPALRPLAEPPARGRLPLEGWIELPLVSEEELLSNSV